MCGEGGSADKAKIALQRTTGLSGLPKNKILGEWPAITYTLKRSLWKRPPERHLRANRTGCDCLLSRMSLADFVHDALFNRSSLGQAL
jgi:hypothetical protein